MPVTEKKQPEVTRAWRTKGQQTIIGADSNLHGLLSVLDQRDRRHNLCQGGQYSCMRAHHEGRGDILVKVVQYLQCLETVLQQ